MIGTSLTTTGANTPTSALAVDRFPMGSAFHYERTQTVTDDVAKSIRANNAVIVVHGIDYDGSGKFTNVLGASELDPKRPQVATSPALCGVMRKQMSGGVAAGAGSTQGLQHTGLMSAGGAAIAPGHLGCSRVMVGKVTVGVKVADTWIAENLQVDIPLSCRLTERGNAIGRRGLIWFSGVQLHPETWTNGYGNVGNVVQEQNADGSGALGPEIGDDTCAHGNTGEHGLVRHTPNELVHG